MKKILFNLGLVSGCLVFSVIHSQTQAQTRTVTGTVNNGEKPISGVVVSQEGSSQMTTTTDSGAFSLQITGETPILIFRHPEYGERKLDTDGKSTFTISLTEKVKSIEEVVLNAGYYNVKAKESTGSISKVTAKDIENQPVNNVLSAVQGRMAGVSIVQNSGVAGGGFEVQIRGQNSLRREGKYPLYIVDGVPLGNEMTSMYSATILPGNSMNPLNSISPNDIESIEVMKDADATAIYGSRGANGVILISTKNSRSGKLKVDINASTSLSEMTTHLKMLNTSQYIDMRKKAFLNDGIASYPANAYDINGVWDHTRDTDWQKKLLRNVAQNNTARISLSGGSEMTNFLLNIEHNDQTNIFSNNLHYTGTNISSKINHKSKDSRFLINLSNMFSLLKNNLIVEDLTKKSIVLAPNAPQLYNLDQSINWENYTFSNPAAIFNSSYTNENIQYLNSINLQYTIAGNLTVKLNGGLNYQNFEEWSLKPHTINNPGTASGQSSAYSQSYRSQQNRMSMIVEPQLNYHFGFTNHHFDVLLGSTYQQEKSKQSSFYGTGFESNVFIQNIAAAKNKTINDFVNTEYKYLAFFGRFNYKFSNKYFVNLTGRRDGSSRFGPNNKFANFWAIGGAWILSEEHFLKNQSWLSLAKLRGSIGVTGSDKIGDYQYLDTYTISSTSYNNTIGLLPSRLYNPDYSWEKTSKKEIALELGFFKDRIVIASSWYQNKSSNQLVGYQLPATTGFTSVIANLDATIQNTGLEFEAYFKPFTTKRFRWESGFNISFPVNKLLEFPDIKGSTYNNSYVVGQPISIVKVYNFLGIDPSTGLYRFQDYNNDGKITAQEDKQMIENIGVKYFGGWHNSFQYKNWDLSFLFQFVKQKNWNYNSIMGIPGSMNNQPIEVLNVWSAENTNASYMPYSTGANAVKTQLHIFYTGSTAAVSDASFIRLKNVELAYRIPIREKIIKDAKVYFQGQNLLIITSYFGMDPEFRSIGFMPPLRTYSFGLLLTL